MVSQNNYNLSASEDIVIFSTSKLTTCFIDGFTLGRESQSLVDLLVEVHIYIRFRTLKVKCTQYGICRQAAFKNAKAIFISKSGGVGCNLSSWESCFFYGADRAPIHLPLKAPECCRWPWISARECFGHRESVNTQVILNPTGYMLASSGFDAFIHLRYIL